MNVSRSTLKGDARQRMIGKYGVAMCALLLADLLTSLLLSLVPSVNLYTAGSLSIITSLVASLIIFLLNMILSAGNNYFYLNMARGRQYAVSDIFYGFRNQPDRIILLTARLLLLSLGCALPFLLTVFFIPIPLWTAVPVPAAYLLSLPHLGAGLLSAVLLFWLYLNYMPVYYLCADHPELTPGELMKTSRQMMHGHKLALLQLEFSFAGLFLLGVLSLGIGLLWVLPYRNMTNTVFYIRGLTAPSPADGE